MRARHDVARRRSDRSAWMSRRRSTPEEQIALVSPPRPHPSQNAAPVMPIVREVTSGCRGAGPVLVRVRAAASFGPQP